MLPELVPESHVELICPGAVATIFFVSVEESVLRVSHG